eukprot:12781394-Heterocapsa_arctica.AAC.1
MRAHHTPSALLAHLHRVDGLGHEADLVHLQEQGVARLLIVWPSSRASRWSPSGRRPPLGTARRPSQRRASSSPSRLGHLTVH